MSGWPQTWELLEGSNECEAIFKVSQRARCISVPAGYRATELQASSKFFMFELHVLHGIATSTPLNTTSKTPVYWAFSSTMDVGSPTLRPRSSRGADRCTEYDEFCSMNGMRSVFFRIKEIEP